MIVFFLHEQKQLMTIGKEWDDSDMNMLYRVTPIFFWFFGEKETSIDDK